MEINNCCFSLRGYNKACWVIEKRCNLNCEFCFFNQFNIKQQNKSFSKSNYSKIVSMLLENNIRHVILSGGEPLLSSNLFDIIQLLEKHGFIISISTNATMATPQFCDLLKKTTVRKLTVNIASICDNKGMIVDNASSHLVVKGIQNLSSSGFSVTLNTILHTSTTKEILLQNVEYSKRLGVETISFTVPVCKSACECYDTDFFIDYQTVKKIQSYLEEIEQASVPTINIVFNYPNCDSSVCPANKEIFGIGETGILSTCLVKQYKGVAY